MAPSRQHICLRDGRKLCYYIDGPAHLLEENAATSVPIIFAFHAMFLSGTSFFQNPPPTDYIVVSMNRPGYHGSSLIAIGEYGYCDFAQDAKELADHLGVDKFSVVGHSSGGPNALACANYLKDKILSIAVMAGDPEYAEEDSKQQSDTDNGVGSSMMGCLLGCFLPNFMRFVPFIQVTNGMKNDYYLEHHKWPFRIEDITQPAMIVFGDQDTILPNSEAVKVHNRLPINIAFNPELKVSFFICLAVKEHPPIQIVVERIIFELP